MVPWYKQCILHWKRLTFEAVSEAIVSWWASIRKHNSFYSNQSMWVGVAVGGAYIKCGNGRRMHMPAHALCAQTEIRMAESEAASIVEATTESQDSQNTIEYSLQGTNGSLSGDTADHPENIPVKKAHEADSPEGKTVSPGIKNPLEQMNTVENQGGQVEDGERILVLQEVSQRGYTVSRRLQLRLGL